MVAPTSTLIASACRPAPDRRRRVQEQALHSPDGDDLGEATFAEMIHPGEEIIAGSNQRFRVLDVVTFEAEDSPLVGLLQVERCDV